MCGITGLFDLDGRFREHGEVIREMAAQIAHCGPDDENILCDGPLAFGFRRLSIIHLETGKQPIANEDQSVCVGRPASAGTGQEIAPEYRKLAP